MPASDFVRILSRTEVLLKRDSNALVQTRLFTDRGNIGSTYGMTFTFETVLEKTVLLARVLPAYTGHPNAAMLTEQLLEKSIPVEMGFTAQDWFCLRISALLPKKEGGSAAYVRDFLYPAMRRFFAGKPLVSYPDCVLIFRHVYDQTRPERAWRDHDNIEVNIVADVIALYLLLDDAPRRCAHYYCSAAGPRERTEVYVIPCEDLGTWIHAEKNDGLKEARLYENPL